MDKYNSEMKFKVGKGGVTYMAVLGEMTIFSLSVNSCHC